MKRKRLALFRTRSRHPCALIGCSRQPDCPEESQALPLPDAGLRYSRAVLTYQREESDFLEVDTQRLLTGSRAVTVCIAHESGNRHKGEGSGSCLQDNRAVGNSRLTPREGLSVSCKQLPDLSPWHDPNHQQGILQQHLQSAVLQRPFAVHQDPLCALF